MKREIVCGKCVTQIYQLIGAFPGEYQKVVTGKAKQTFVCDGCRKILSEGDKCHCVTMWTDYGGHLYVPWEDEFIFK